ncbi:hypothetical protein M3J09_008587 [Ascochyta lentis]
MSVPSSQEDGRKELIVMLLGAWAGMNEGTRPHPQLSSMRERQQREERDLHYWKAAVQLKHLELLQPLIEKGGERALELQGCSRAWCSSTPR